ncbi:Myb-related protein P [Echinococcus multilocularis]|uniref:Myb-related protein P n=1 Tax=Echinococcus multilocularis TaxID=6211 RepID=A0A0S4MM31_ECHMU|nr:Myb-related protein P [Echinococcus multilocularis]
MDQTAHLAKCAKVGAQLCITWIPTRILHGLVLHGEHTLHAPNFEQIRIRDWSGYQELACHQVPLSLGLRRFCRLQLMSSGTLWIYWSLKVGPLTPPHYSARVTGSRV